MEPPTPSARMKVNAMKRTLTAALLIGMNMTVVARAGDWPMWRYDSARSAVSPDELSENLRLAWQRDLPSNHVAWTEDPRLHFDACVEPVVVGQTILVASSTTDSVTALDTDSGRQLWKFYVDGPVRFAPVVHEGHAYFGADDGHFYCVDVGTGRLVWQFRAAPADRRVVGNERLISVWPARGGAVLGNDRLYFAVGVWPFEGALLYSLDLRSDDAVPHYRVTALSNISPQGYLALNSKRLFVPGGRANATCIDLTTGETVGLNYSSSGLTDYHVATGGRLLFHGAAVYHTDLGRMMPFELPRPVFDGELLIGTGDGKLLAYDMTKRETFTAPNERGEDVERDRVPLAWELAAEEIAESEQPPRVLIKAGHRWYGHRGSVVFAVNPTQDGQPPRVAWTTTIDGRPGSMLAADDKLFVVTREGRIYCFAGDATEPSTYAFAPTETEATDPEWSRKTVDFLRHSQDPNGYCLVLGVGSGQLITQLVRQSDMRVIVIDSAADAIQKLRSKIDAMGLYGTRIVAIAADPRTIHLPPYLASLIVSEELHAVDLSDPQFLTKFYEWLRPYGGAAVFRMDDRDLQGLRKTVEAVDLRNAKLTHVNGLAVLKRFGPLPGASDWTHEYGDSSNTLMSMDDRVRAPLGLLWFGGPAGSGELFFDRHYWGPGLTVVDGRMFVQGPQRLSAIDIYTGRVLWKKHLRAGLSPGRRGNFFDLHKPGFHFVTVSDGVYLAYPDVCLRLDPKTGKTLSELKLVSDEDQWGKVRVWQNLLIVNVFRLRDELGLVPSAVAAIERHTGELVWSTDAAYGSPLVAVGGDKVFFFDGMLTELFDAWKRVGKVPDSSGARSLRALDIKTGRQLWEAESQRIATWLAYSQEHDILVVSNKRGVDALRGESGEVLWQKQEEAPGFDGHPENVWDKVIVSGDLVIDQRGPGQAFSLKTGELAVDRHPITGEATPWRFTKTGHHCNYAIASPHLVTFRAGTAGFFDRHTKGTARLRGFRSGCRNSLIPAGGVLNAPNYAHGCSCSYNVFTSLAFVHMPEADLWTYNAYRSPESSPERFGINFGAPGGRMAKNGTLWLEYPRSGHPSATIAVEIEGDSLSWYRRHSAQIAGPGPKWVGASGVKGVSGLKIQFTGLDRDYTVRLFFVEPDHEAVGDRVFDVALQGQTVLQNFDIVREVGAARKLLQVEFTGIKATEGIDVTFSARQGEPLISGVEIVAGDALR